METITHLTWRMPRTNPAEPSPVGLLTANPEQKGRIVELNRAFAFMMGSAGPEEILGRPFDEYFLNRGDWPVFLSGLKRCQQPAGTNLVLKALDGTPRWGLAYAWIDERTGMLRVILHDETELVRAQAMMARQLVLQSTMATVSNSLLRVRRTGSTRLREALILIRGAFEVEAVSLFARTGRGRRAVNGFIIISPPDQPRLGGRLFSRDDSLRQWLAELGETMPAPVSGGYPRLVNGPDLNRFGLKAALSAPVFVRGRLHGFLVAGNNRQERLWEAYETEAFRTFADLIGSAVERWRDECELRHWATHDALTGLANRRAFERRIRDLQARPAAYPVSILTADVNGLKAINDHRGHAAGDRLLKLSARVLRQGLRKNDLLARLGGDEFAILLPATGIETAQAIKAELQKAMRKSMPPGQPGLSFGVATARRPGQPLDGILRLADRRMYDEKESRRMLKNETRERDTEAVQRNSN